MTRSIRRLDGACNRVLTGMLSRKHSNPLECYEPMDVMEWCSVVP